MKDLLRSPNQSFFAERIKKELVARATWNIQYGHKYLKEASKTRKQPRKATFGSVLKECPVPVTGSPIRKGAPMGWLETKGVQDQVFKPGCVQVDRIKQVRGPPRYTTAPGKPEDLKMRHPTPATLKLLFQGISHEGQGRALYLKERNRLKPEEKYKYPMVSSWDYGWHVGDVMKDFRTPVYARTHPITKSFYLKSGIFHIPRRSDDVM